MLFKVLTFNVHHHEDSRDVNCFDEQLDVIASADAHITFLQEVEQFTGYNGNRDSLAAMVAGLQTRWPGKTLHTLTTHQQSVSTTQKGQHVSVIVKDVPSAPVLIGRSLLAYSRSMLMFKQVFNGRTLNFATFHLMNGQATPGDFRTPNEGQRVSQEVDLNYNATNLMVPTSNPRFFVGDFNTLPGQPSLDPMRLWYNDAWAEAPVKSQPARCVDGETYMAGNPPFDATDYDRRIDYVFYGKKTWSNMSWVRVLDATVMNIFRPDGSLASDHLPLLVSFDIL